MTLRYTTYLCTNLKICQHVARLFVGVSVAYMKKYAFVFVNTVWFSSEKLKEQGQKVKIRRPGEISSRI